MTTTPDNSNSTDTIITEWRAKLAVHIKQMKRSGNWREELIAEDLQEIHDGLKAIKDQLAQNPAGAETHTTVSPPKTLFDMIKEQEQANAPAPEDTPRSKNGQLRPDMWTKEELAIIRTSSSEMQAQKNYEIYFGNKRTANSTMQKWHSFRRKGQLLAKGVAVKLNLEGNLYHNREGKIERISENGKVAVVDFGNAHINVETDALEVVA